MPLARFDNDAKAPFSLEKAFSARIVPCRCLPGAFPLASAVRGEQGSGVFFERGVWCGIWGEGEAGALFRNRGGACRQPALPRTLRPGRGRVCAGRGIARDVPVCVPGQRPVSRVCERGACRTRYTKTVPACAPRAGNRKRGSILHTCRIGCAPRSGKVHEDSPLQVMCCARPHRAERGGVVGGPPCRQRVGEKAALRRAGESLSGRSGNPRNGCALPYRGRRLPGAGGHDRDAPRPCLRREKGVAKGCAPCKESAASPCGEGAAFCSSGKAAQGPEASPQPCRLCAPPLPSPPPWASIAVREAGAFRVFFPAFFCPALPVPQPGIIHVR